jgi:hypothetical protein
MRSPKRAKQRQDGADHQDSDDAALLIAASLRGLRLHGMPGGLYAVYRVTEGRVVPLQAWQDIHAVRALLGARAGVSLRAAAEHDGLRWPATPAAFLAAMTSLSLPG